MTRVTHNDASSLKSVTGPSGKLLTSQHYYSCGEDAASADPYGDVAVVARTNATSIHTINHSKRSGLIDGWTTSFDGGGTSRQWLNRGGDVGRVICNPSEFWKEGIGGNLSVKNPTFGGAAKQLGVTSTNRIFPSPLVYYRHDPDGGSPSFESCVIPLDFDSSGFSSGADMGGDEATLVLWWTARQYFRLQTNVMPNVHRFTTWLYFPEAWGTGGAEFYAYVVGMALEKAFAAAPGDWLNVENGVRTPIDTDPNWTTSNNCLWLYDRQNSGQRVGDPGNGTFTTPFGADRYFASILNNLGTIAVGLAAGVRTENDVRAFNQVNANLSNAITGSALLDGTALVGTNLIAANQAIGGGVSASRPAGWIGHTFLVATQPTKQAVTTSLVDARTRGLLDAKPEFSVPREVLQDL